MNEDINYLIDNAEFDKKPLLNYITNLQEENRNLRKKIKYLEMIIEYKHELRQTQDESEIHNELYR